MGKEALAEFYRIIDEKERIKRDDIAHIPLEHDDFLDILQKGDFYQEVLLLLRNLPFDIIDMIARNGDSRIKSIICMKWPLLDETYEYIYRDKDVRSSLCSNPALPQTMIDRLLNDDCEFVRNSMQEVLDYRAKRSERISKLEAEKEKKANAKKCKKERKIKENRERMLKAGIIDKL